MMRRIDRFLYQKEKSLWTKMVLFPLYLLSLPYGGFVRTRNLLYSFGLIKTKRLPCPVISVGNITVGGTGKTPLVMALAKGLRERGISVAILNRGYKGKKTTGALVGDGETVFLSPEESGDESYFMAKALPGIPVLVGKDRFRIGQMALQHFRIRGLLLDDGYQHLQLYRDLNIMLIDSQTVFGDQHLFPRGILREPLAYLHRAQLFLLTKVEHLEACQPLEAILYKINPASKVFHSHYEPMGLISPDGKWETPSSLQGKRVLALSGIANPDYFTFLLTKCGGKVVEEVIFPDHHDYTLNDLTFIREKVNEVDWVVTTEKDMVKLKEWKVNHLPIRALRIEVKLWEEKEFFQRVMEIF